MKDPIRTVKIKALTKTGEKLDALQNLCNDCGHGAFVVFTIDGDSHSHLQCADCGTVYCHGADHCGTKGMTQ